MSNIFRILSVGSSLLLFMEMQTHGGKHKATFRIPVIINANNGTRKIDKIDKIDELNIDGVEVQISSSFKK